MLNIRFDGKLDYLIDNIGFVNVSRNAGFAVPYKTGKQKYSLIFVESGEMNYYFTKNKKMIDSGEFTVIESAYLTGFNNMSFFYEVYNKFVSVK